MNKTTASFPLLVDDPRWSGEVEVLEVRGPPKTIAVQLHLGGRSVPIPRNRIAEVIAALQEADTEASTQYQQIIEEMNQT